MFMRLCLKKLTELGQTENHTAVCSWLPALHISIPHSRPNAFSCLTLYHW